MFAAVRTRFLGRFGFIVETKQDVQVSVPKELTVVWKINNFFSLSGKGGDYYESPDFDFSDARWSLRIFSNGDKRNEPSGFVDLFLVRKDEGTPMSIQCTIGIEGVERLGIKNELECVFSRYVNSSGWYNFLSRSLLKDHQCILMPDNMMTISCTMKIAVSSPAGGISSHQDTSSPIDGEFEESRVEHICTDGRQKLNKQDVEGLEKSLQRLLQSGEDCDVILKVQGKEFPAHRAILRVRSPVFYAMFSHDMVEKRSGVVTMEDCDSESFSDFLEHVYTNSVDMISSSNVASLYTASDKYDLSTLKKECMEFMKQNLSVDSFCNIIILAIKHSDEDLIEQATAFFCDHSLEIVERAEWQTFLQENSTVGNELFIKAMKYSQEKYFSLQQSLEYDSLEDDYYK